jgi:hypothetical protein
MRMKECDVFGVRCDGGREADNEVVSFSVWLSKKSKRVRKNSKQKKVKGVIVAYESVPTKTTTDNNVRYEGSQCRV